MQYSSALPTAGPSHNGLHPNPLYSSLLFTFCTLFFKAAAFDPAHFNSTNDSNTSFDTRSDNKGPEPEGLDLGVVDNRLYLFLGLERIGGVVIYDITSPTAPLFTDWVSNRNWAGDPQAGAAGDLGPEGILFVKAGDSPTGEPLLITSNEISGTLSIFAVRPD